jgi:hypothetical protein
MPWDKSKYPKNWKQIRAQILERAGNKCEWCGVNNHALGYRRKDGKFIECRGMEIEVAGLIDDEKIIQIILTIAHVKDPDPMNCAPDNLAALCQKCHNKLDAPMRAKNAARTRVLKKQKKAEAAGQLSIFGGKNDRTV